MSEPDSIDFFYVSDFDSFESLSQQTYNEDDENESVNISLRSSFLSSRPSLSEMYNSDGYTSRYVVRCMCFVIWSTASFNKKQQTNRVSEDLARY